jgi:signal peptidase II
LSHKIKLIGLTLTLILVLDQGTKIIVDRTIPLHHSIPVIDNLFNLTHIRNTGAAFGILAGRRGWVRSSFLLFFSLVAMVFIVVLLRRIDCGSRARSLEDQS